LDDTRQLDLGQAFRNGQAAPAGEESSEVEHRCLELEEAHDLLDALGAGDRGQTVADRLRDFIERAAGQRVAATLNPEFGKALARFHLEHSGHSDMCSCNPCRQARQLR
jgi:hypothetical protein